MNREENITTINRTARIAGILYLLVAILGGFSILFVTSVLIEPGDAAATAKNITEGESLFRLGFVSGLITQVIQIGLVLALYRLLKTVNKNQAVLMVAFSLIGIPIAMLNQLNQFAGFVLMSAPEYLTIFFNDQAQSLGMFFFELQKHGINIATIFWGLWLIPLGLLVFKSEFIPKLFGILLIIGGFGYLVDFFTFALFPEFNVTLSEFTFIGELLLPLWLLIKGVNVDKWKKQVLDTP
jgi:hypothetical protein